MEQYRFHLEKYHTGCKSCVPNVAAKPVLHAMLTVKGRLNFPIMSAGVTTNKVVAITLRQEAIFKKIRKFSTP